MMQHVDIPIRTVSQLTRDIKDSLEDFFASVEVAGEISNFHAHASGHWYFTLKDSRAQLSAVMFRGNAQSMYFRPQDGMELVCSGRITVYEARGQYQLVVSRIQPRGQGTLQLAFEKLKRKLFEEGLFDEKRKRPLPRFPSTVALVTSRSGAAIRDMISVIHRRNPSVRLLVVPVQVQGAGASEQIVKALELCNEYEDIDVIITGRGGGSIEDLWAFNEEIVARAIAASRIPVISAVGHETDVSIADYVADLRAATPSVAAELVTPSIRDIFYRLEETTLALGKFVSFLLRSRIRDVRDLLSDRAFTRLSGRMQSLMQLSDERTVMMHRAVEQLLRRRQHDVDLLKERLNGHDPQRLFKRGIALIRRNGRPIMSVTELREEDRIGLELRDGRIAATVEEIEFDGEKETRGNRIVS